MKKRSIIHNRFKRVAAALLLLHGFFSSGAQARVDTMSFASLMTEPKSYVVSYTSQPPLIDGDLSDAAWATAEWSAPFVDIEGSRKPVPTYATNVKMLWGDSCLYLAARLQETHVWATLKQHDAIIYHDNDFEIFIDPNNDAHQYFEVEVNALNKVLDLFMPKPYRNYGQALLSYTATGLRTGVKVMGSLNNAADYDSGWTVEAAIPYKAVTVGNNWQTPTEGTLWRINFSRVQWQIDIVNGKYQKRRDAQGKGLPENNWVWSPQGVIDMHYPERWGYLQFTKQPTGKQGFVLPASEKRRQLLWLLYYRQKAYAASTGTYAKTIKELGIENSQPTIEGETNRLRMEATSRQFSVYITNDQNTLSVNEEGLIRTLKKIE